MSNWLYSRERHARTNNFAVLLVAQLIFLLLPAIFQYLQADWLVAATLTLVILVSSYIVTVKPHELFIAVTLAALAVILSWVDVYSDSIIGPILNDLAGMAFFVYVALKLAIRKIAKLKEVDLNSLFAAICGFIYLGIIGGYLVELVDITTPGGAFSEADMNPNSYIYFSFVTITTLGYGDITPVTPTARTAAILLAISGQMYITVIIAVIVGKLAGSFKS